MQQGCSMLITLITCQVAARSDSVRGVVCGSKWRVTTSTASITKNAFVHI